MLLELFPDAKFVAIHRSPYEVFPSTINLHRKILNLTSFQDYDEDLIEHNVLTIYEQVMEKYLEDRVKIPAGNLIEVAYEDLDTDPLGTVASIYLALGIDRSCEARSALAEYVHSQSSYKKNGFVISERASEIIEERWSFAFKALGYPKRFRQTADSFLASSNGTGSASAVVPV